jgi:PAS domain S-box-containing protein
VLNPDGYFVRANPAWLHLLGWTEETLCKMSYRELIHPEDLDAAARTFESLKHGTPILRIENRYRSKDGEYFWFTWAAAPLGNHYYSSGRDITAERHQGEQLAARTAERDRVWRHSRDLLVVIGPDGIVRDVNPAWTTILGHPIAEVIGHSFHDFVWPDDKALAEQGLQSAARAKDRGEFENRFRHLDGSPHWISWHTSVEEDLVYAYGRDITTVKRAQSELAQAQDALRQSQKMEAVGQLTGGIAHDFNNLLQAITGSLERLQRQLPGDRIADIDRHLGAAMESANRAAALTHRLLAFSRRQTLDPKPTNLNTFLTRMQGALRHTMGAEVAIEFQGGRHLWDTKVDPSQLENAVVNLCLNARDAMPGGGRLRIETANRRLDEPRSDCALPTGQYVVLSVSDSGTGMTPGVLARVFDPFFTTKPLGRGTGLGLSMVYGFVRQSGGHVRIQSEVGRGTTLQLFFPRHTPQAVRLEPPVRVETPAPGLGETILVVDDEPTVRMLITDVLEEKRYRVLDAADGPSALEILQSDIRIDLLITDVGLPGGMNGRQVADAGRVGRPSLQVLFITGFAENAAVGDGHLDTGMQILTKPFPMARLTAKVHDILAH